MLSLINPKTGLYNDPEIMFGLYQDAGPDGPGSGSDPGGGAGETGGTSGGPGDVTGEDPSVTEFGGPSGGGTGAGGTWPTLVNAGLVQEGTVIPFLGSGVNAQMLTDAGYTFQKSMNNSGETIYTIVSSPGATTTKEGTTTPTEPTAEEQSASAIQEYLQGQVTDPSLPSGTDFQFTPITEQAGEQIDPALAGQGVTTQFDRATALAPSYTVSDQALAELVGITPSTYQAFTVDGVTGVVDPRQLLTYQLAELYKDFDEGTPAWAAGAIRYANGAMQKRGLGASSMAGAAISQAIMEVAVPIAQYDADQYGNMNILNLRNQQEALLSNQSAINASKQFNSQSINQINMFMAQLRDGIIKFNVEQLNGMSRFNTEQDNAMYQFQKNLQAQQEQFVNKNMVQIAASNSEWRRALNLANTAGINAENQIRTQNLFNLSQDAVDKLWQANRDLFYWANVSTENDRDRALKLSLAQMQQADYRDASDSATMAGLGNILGGLAADIIKKAF